MTRRWLTGMCAVALLVTACAGGGSEAGAGQERPDRSTTTQASASLDGCRQSSAPATPDGPSAEAVSLGRVNGHEVEAVVYPRPDERGDPWSQWSQGLALEDGRFLSAAGDHYGPDGNSYLFVYDPQQRRLVRFSDVLSQVEHRKGEWGYGKVHAQIVAGSCGDAFVATYWGTDKNLTYGGSYRGDLLFRLDTSSLELELLDVPVPQHGIPTLAGFTPEGLVYGEAATPTPANAAGSEQGAFFAYDVTARKIAFRADDERLNGFRNVMVGADGTAYVAARDSRLLVYEPGSETLRLHPEPLPGGTLRASTSPGPDGTVYGVTQDPARLFALRPDGTIDDLGPARGYTASLALASDGRRFFYVPGAHGNSAKQGTPLIAVDTKTGEQTTVATLNKAAEQKLGLTLGGSYSVAVDPSGDRVYIGLNAGRDPEDPWGEVVLVVVDLE